MVNISRENEGAACWHWVSGTIVLRAAVFLESEMAIFREVKYERSTNGMADGTLGTTLAFHIPVSRELKGAGTPKVWYAATATCAVSGSPQ